MHDPGKLCICLFLSSRGQTQEEESIFSLEEAVRLSGVDTVGSTGPLGQMRTLQNRGPVVAL